LSDLLELYAELHIRSGFATSRRWKYGYDSFDNGVKISLPVRRAYRTLQESERAAFGDPFRTSATNCFLEWVTDSASAEDRYSPFLTTLYSLRPDVMTAFPDIRGKDRDKFLEWASTSGASEFGYDPVAMRVAGNVPHRRALPSRNEITAESPTENFALKCSIIIPVHNNAALTRKCLESVFATLPREIQCEIIVVDDGSTDSTSEILNTYGNRIRVITHSINKGFALSCNDGAAVAGGEYLIFLNNDTIPEPGWLNALVRYADMHPMAAAVGSKLLFPNDTIQHCGIVICEDGEPRHLYAGFPADHPAVNRPRKLKAVTGACILIRPQDFRIVNGFDPAFRNGYEDVDLCLRLGELAREIHCCLESELYHLEAITREPSNGNQIQNRNLYRSRWADRTSSDEIDHYLSDGLLKLEYPPFFPIRFSISPLLATVGGAGRQTEADRLIEARSRQVIGLLKDNIRLNVRVQQAELREQPRHRNNSSGSPLMMATIEQPRILHRGQMRHPANRPTERIISIVLPVKNGRPKLEKLLPAIMTQKTRDYVEIVAVDSGSKDGSVELLKQFDATVVSIDPRSFNHGLTRNLATTYASGSIFVFLNQSTLPANDYWLANLVRPLAEHGSLAAVCGRVLPREDADLLTRWEIHRNVNASSERIVTEITDWNVYRSLTPHVLRAFVNFHTLSAAIRADVFRKIPFRDANFAEDLIWGKEALESGLRIQFEPSSIAFHSHNYSLLDIFRRNFDDGVACHEIVGITMDDRKVLPDMREIRNIWRYLEHECGLKGEALEEWRIRAAVRRTVQLLGQWLGLNFHCPGGDYAALLSLTEQIKTGAMTEISDGTIADAHAAR
jgi:GT2 family glycosyltransferase